MRQGSPKLAARADVELGEHLAQVIRDGVLADEQPRADLGVREALGGEPRDLGLLRGQIAAGLDGALAGALAGGEQLALGARGERLDPHRGEHLERRTQLFAGVEPAALAPEPFAVEQMAAGVLHTDARAPEALARLAMEAVGLLARGEQPAAAGLGSERPVGAARAGRLREPHE